MNFEFRDATRQQAKASILIEGLSGRGKSGLALMLGFALAHKDWQKVFAIDTENKSLDLFEGLTMSTGDKCQPFKKIDLLPCHGYSPSNYNTCKDNAVTMGGEVIINDSVTHLWQQEGGILDLVAKVQQKDSRRYNNYTAWGAPEVAEEKKNILKVLRDERIHVISTVRVKEKFEMTSDGVKTSLQSIGEQQQMLPDAKYEADLVLHMLKPGAMNGAAPVAKVVKSRYAILAEGEVYQFTPDLCDQIVKYLEEGTDPEILREQQRQDFLKAIGEKLKTDPLAKANFEMVKQELGIGDKKSADYTLAEAQAVFSAVCNN